MVEFAEINIRKGRVNDEELFEIIGWTNIANVEDVPREYIMRSPAFALHDNKIVLVDEGVISIGDKFTKIEIKFIQKYLKAAGPRFTKIHRKIEKQTREHSGEYTFIV